MNMESTESLQGLIYLVNATSEIIFELLFNYNDGMRILFNFTCKISEFWTFQQIEKRIWIFRFNLLQIKAKIVAKSNDKASNFNCSFPLTKSCDIHCIDFKLE